MGRPLTHRQQVARFHLQTPGMVPVAVEVEREGTLNDTLTEVTGRTTRGIFVRDTASDETALISKGFTVKSSNTRKVLAVVVASLLLAGLAAIGSRALLRRRRRPAHAATG